MGQLDCRLGAAEGTGKGVSAGLAKARFAGADVAARARPEAGAGRRHEGREPDQQNLSPLESVVPLLVHDGEAGQRPPDSNAEKNDRDQRRQRRQRHSARDRRSATRVQQPVWATRPVVSLACCRGHC